MAASGEGRRKRKTKVTEIRQPRTDAAERHEAPSHTLRTRLATNRNEETRSVVEAAEISARYAGLTIAASLISLVLHQMLEKALPPSLLPPRLDQGHDFS